MTPAPGTRVVQWLNRAAAPSYRLFLLHHAGGSAATFRPWQRSFPPDWDVCTVGVPGRGRLHDVAPVADCAELVEFLLPATQGWLDVPYGLFGHSMGGLLAYELTRALHGRGDPLPSWLGISACRPPRVQLRNRAERGQPLPDEQLRGWLAEYGDTPAGLLTDEGIWRLFRPMFRADFDLVGSWAPDPDAPPLPVPITAFGGRDDPLVSSTELGSWAEHTEHFLGTHLYPGEHFYLSAHRRQIARQIALCILYIQNGIRAS